MCGRFTLFEADKILSKEFGVSGIPLLSPRYNIAPSQPVAAVRVASSDDISPAQATVIRAIP